MITSILEATNIKNQEYPNLTSCLNISGGSVAKYTADIPSKPIKKYEHVSSLAIKCKLIIRQISGKSCKVIWSPVQQAGQYL